MHHSIHHPLRRRAIPFSTPEALESRIAPAAVLPEISSNGKTATWTDVDGDTIVLSITKGTLDAVENFDLESGPNGSAILQKLDLTAAEFRGTNVTIKAIRDANLGGDNLVNIGFIDATDNNLGAVKIAGDLAQISAGKTVLTAKTATAIKSLNVKSMGLAGDSSLDQPGDLFSSVSGKIGSLTVTGSIEGVSLNVTGGTLGSIGAIKIGGSLIGTDSANSGQIITSGNIGSVTINGGVLGGSGQSSGVIDAGGNIKSLSIKGSIFGGKSDVPGTDNTGIVRADGTIGSVKIGGSIEGGTQQRSGLLEAGSDIKSLQITGSIVGGEAGALSGAVNIGGNVTNLTVSGGIQGGGAEQSGYISVSGSVGNLTVKGSLVGGTAAESGVLQLGTDPTAVIKKVTVMGSVHGGSGDMSGAIQSAGTIANLTIGGNIIGGDLEAAAIESLNHSGYIEAASITKLTVSGSLQAGTNYSVNPALELLSNASIRVENNIGSLTVKGDLIGNADASVLITARGIASVPFSATKDVAFGSISVGGSVRYAEILAGYDTNDDLAAAAVNPNAQIGSVTVKADWIASSLVAGAAYNDNFGDGSDTKNAGVENPDIIASIAKITIGGTVIGTSETADDHFGFVAEQIVRFQIGAGKAGLFSLNTGASNDNDPVSGRYNVGGTDDTRIFEFAQVRVLPN